MGFIHTYSIRIKTCFLISSLQGKVLSRSCRGCHAQTLTITGTSYGFNHCIDLISIPFRICEPFQNYRSNPFTNHNPISIFVKGVGNSLGRESLGFTEAEVGKCRLYCVKSPGDCKITFSRFQLGYSQI